MSLKWNKSMLTNQRKSNFWSSACFFTTLDYHIRFLHLTVPVKGAGRQSFAPGDLNPPEVQCYIVEHVVRSSDTSLRATHRLRMFSGKVPRPNQEMDNDT